MPRPIPQEFCKDMELNSFLFLNYDPDNTPSKSKALKDHEKPKLVVPHCYRDLAKARSAWRSSLVTRKPNVVAAKEFVYYKLREHEQVNAEKWESYGVVIAEPGEKVNPFCMYTVSTEDCEPESVGADQSDKYDKTLLMYALTMYRLTTVDNDAQRSRICKEIQGQMTSLAGAPTLLQLIPESSSFRNERNFGKLVAGMDMFLFRFPQSPLVALRVATSWTRYQSCAGLSAVLYFMKITGTKEVKEVDKWLFIDHVLKEFKRMLSPEEEAEKESSYMPYMDQMSLIGRGSSNPFSFRANPNLYYFVHGVGALMGIQHSINAKMPHDYNVNVASNIKPVAYALKNFKSEIQKRAGAEPSGLLANPEMYKSLVSTMVVYQKTRNLPDMNEKLQELMNNIVNPRQGTIGYHVKHNLV